MSPEQARALLAGDDSATDAGGDREPDQTLAVTEASRSFQTRLSTALTTFTICLDERGLSFIGLPGSGEPGADDPGYLSALVLCNAESNIAAVIQEQDARNGDLSPAERQQLNRAALDLADCMADHGWDFGELEPNRNGILMPRSFPSDIGTRRDEFDRDLDRCGWYDLTLG